MIRPANADTRKLITGATSVGLHRFPVGHGYTVDEDGPDGFGSPSLALVPYVPTGSVRIPSTKLLVPPFVLDHGGSTTYHSRWALTTTRIPLSATASPPST